MPTKVMKNIKLYHDQELLDYIGSLWQSDEIKSSYALKRGPVWEMVNMATRYPLFFYEQSHPIERTQFSSWWRFIQKRDYFNPNITDLYYLHELSHIAARQYPQDGTFDNFKVKSVDNELTASIYSEVLVYLSFPTLRAKTFDFEIWADRFIKNGAEPTQKWINLIVGRRRNAMLDPDVNDPVEMSINKYNVQNQVWFNIWKNSHQKIDNAMFAFIRGNQIHPETGHARPMFSQAACDDLVQFLKDNTQDEVAFYQETNEFHNYIKDNLITIHKEEQHVSK
jgi:hypothetical protein